MWNNEATVNTLKAGMKVGQRIAAYATTCSRYSGIVGEFLGFEEIVGYTMAKVHFPPVKEYEKYTLAGTGSDGKGWSWNLFSIYKDDFTANFPLNGIFIVEDQTLDPGTVLSMLSSWGHTTAGISSSYKI